MPKEPDPTSRCLVCEQGSDTVPLLAFRYRGAERHICPQHLPILIHEPAALADRLPGAEALGPGPSHDCQER